MLDILPPPAIYDHAYAGNLSVEILSLEALRARCIALGSKPSKLDIIYGCAKHDAGIWCLIVLPEVNGWWISQRDQDELRTHELAHCNGWPADHSNPGGGNAGP
jgi:hypothetical protein